jgi:hypothetical protein
MPLAPPAILEAEILKFSDENDPGFTGFPADVQETGEKWADAYIAWLSTAIIPPGLGAVLDRQSMIDVFVGAAVDGVLPPGAGLTIFDQGLTALTGPADALPAVTVPPPAPYVPPALPPITDPAVPALAIATTSLAWAITGTHTVGPPPPPGPWT